MRAVPYHWELPTDRAPSYGAVQCHTCGDYDDLKRVDGKFLCGYCRHERKPSWWAAQIDFSWVS